MQHEYRLAVLKQSDGWGRRRHSGQQLANAADGLEIGAGENRRELIRPDRMTERETDRRPRPAGCAAADRIGYEHHRSAARRKQRVDSVSGPRFLHSVTAQIV